MKELYSEVEIQASPESVWQVLTDFKSFPEWNPFIRSIEGDLRPGSRLKVHLQPSGSKGMTFRPKVLKVEPGQEFRWLGHVLIPGLFDGQHTFKIETLGENRARFIQRERFKGMMLPFLSRRLDTETRRGFKEMNEALKLRVEKIANKVA